jgi:hypothetical protein
MAPALDTLEYLARAVTPPHRHVRFNARFFVADASHAVGDIKGSGELEGVRWLALAEARKLPIPNITGVVLEQLDEMLRHPPAPDPMRPVPLYHMRHGQHRRDQE